MRFRPDFNANSLLVFTLWPLSIAMNPLIGIYEWYSETMSKLAVILSSDNLAS